jgi:hypothetical protein
MKELILITGASSGIGREMARLLAARRNDLILVARREDRLIALRDELEEKHVIHVHIFTADLSNQNTVHDLYKGIQAKGLSVTMLVNNAGFGLYGDFTETDLDDEVRMINLNITALMMLSKWYAAEFKLRGAGVIMNVGSILSFLPFPYYAVYAASKAFVLHFSEALQAELEGTGVRVITLCPGPTDTEFNSERMLSTNAYKSMKPVSAKVVAEKAVAYLAKGNGTKVVGLMNKITANLPRLAPRGFGLKINKHMASQV